MITNRTIKFKTEKLAGFFISIVFIAVIVLVRLMVFIVNDSNLSEQRLNQMKRSIRLWHICFCLINQLNPGSDLFPMRLLADYASLRLELEFALSLILGIIIVNFALYTKK